MGLELLKEKAEENFKTAEWTEKRKYYDAAVSRYYYCAFERVIYISKKNGFYKSLIGEESHVKTISFFVESMKGSLMPEEKVILLNMKKLRRIRNDSDYSESKLEVNGYMLGFKCDFDRVIQIVDKFL